MPVARINLVSNIAARDASESPTEPYSTYKDAGAMECAFQVVKDPGNRLSRVFMTCREGFQLNTGVSAVGGGTVDGTAVKLWTGSSNALVTAFGTPNSTIYENSTSRGAITGLGIWISETMLSGTPTAVIVSASNRAYYLQAGTLTEITDTDFPPKQASPRTITGNFVHLDGYAIIACLDGTIWHSDLNSISAWSSMSSITADRSSDGLLGVIRLGPYVAAMGANTIELYRNARNAAGSILGRVPNAYIEQGVLNQYSMVQYKNGVAFVGKGQHGLGVFLLDPDLQITKISTFPVDMAIVSYIGFVRLHTITQWGRVRLFVVYTEVTPSLTCSGYVYDDDTGLWIAVSPSSIANTDVTTFGTTTTTMYSVGYNANGRSYINAYAGLDPARIKVGPIDFGRPSRRKFCHRVRLIGQSRVARDVGLAWSDDDGANWVSETTRVLDDASGTTLRPQWNRCGSFYRRMWQVSLTPNPSDVAGALGRLEALEIDYEFADY